MTNSSEYINNERREYSLYVLQQRAIPYAADGLKAGARRILWTARNGKTWKSASLAGATVPIHPHALAESSINSLAGDFNNNIPLLDGEGGFGTLLNPTAYAAPRYTSVTVSQFTKDVMFKDIDIIPHQENYDGSLTEPVHFLPLIPMALLNPQEGIAVGFACSILPRSLDTIVKSQLQHLAGKKITKTYPAFTLTDNYSSSHTEDKNGKIKWTFTGKYEKVNATTIRVTNLPYGLTHAKYIVKIAKLEDSGVVVDVVDNSKKTYDIQIKFKKGILRGKSEDEIISLLGLQMHVSENLNLINFDGNRVLSTTYEELIKEFTDWRLGWYLQRYQRLADLLAFDIQRYKDILLAIKHKTGAKVSSFKTKSELKDFLTSIKVVYVDFIAELPVYRFTVEERKKTEAKLKDANTLMDHYVELLSSDEARKEVFVSELKQIATNNKKGMY